MEALKPAFCGDQMSYISAALTPRSCHNKLPTITVECVGVGVEGNRIGFFSQSTDESMTLVLLP